MTEYLSVSTLTKYIKYKFDQDPHLQSVLLKENFQISRNIQVAIYTLMLKIKESVISAMMFKGNASKLGFEPKEGTKYYWKLESLFTREEVTIKFM